MTEKKSDTERVQDLLGSFQLTYEKVLLNLDDLSKGTFDEEEASSMAALCLLAQAALLSELAAADLRSRSLKRDIDFAEATAYSKLKDVPIGGKKPSESALAQLVVLDSEVQRISKEQIMAERDYKHFANVHALLKEAHITFRSIKKGV
jgi:hypothetical protein